MKYYQNNIFCLYNFIFDNFSILKYFFSSTKNVKSWNFNIKKRTVPVKKKKVNKLQFLIKILKKKKNPTFESLVKD